MSQIRNLTPELKKVAEKCFNEDQNRIEENIKYIKEWISKQPHLKIPNSDQWILTFLRGCKYQLESTKKKLDNYYSFRTAFPEILQNRNMTNSPLCDLINLGLFLPFKSNTTETQPLYIYARFNFNPSKYNLNQVLKLYYISYDILLLEYDEMVINGVVFICDLTHSTFSHMSLINPIIAKKTMQIAMQAYPLRFKGIHYLHPPQGFKTIFELVKFFSPDKIKERYFVHSTLTELYEHIPMCDLPKDLGGQNKSIDELNEIWKSKLLEYNEYLINDEQYRSDESLRMDKSKYDTDIYGLEGSFRKLDFD